MKKKSIYKFVELSANDKKVTFSSPLGERMPVGQVRGCRGSLSLIFFLSLLLFSCSPSDSIEDNAESHEVKFGVGFVDVWEKGNFNENNAKAITRGELTVIDPPATNILHQVFVKATNKENPDTKLDLTLENKSKDGTMNPESVTEFDILPPGTITEENYTLYNYEARTIIPEPETETSYDGVWGDGTIPLYGTKDYLSGTGVADDALRVYFPLKHNTILVRFILGVSSEIDALRTLKITSLKIYKKINKNGQAVFDTDDATSEIVSTSLETSDILTTKGNKYLEFHVNPNSAELFEDVAQEMEKEYMRTVLIVAKYDVYDKEEHLLRKDCIAKNTLTLSFTSKAKGKYFDIYATINPDFLYVLSDNDKKSGDLVLK